MQTVLVEQVEPPDFSVSEFATTVKICEAEDRRNREMGALGGVAYGGMGDPGYQATPSI
eukprot:COSAG02_NODE_854_length_16499_cov_76.082561_8_plen_59_part_00